MKRFLTHNAGFKLLAIALAVWIWYGAAYEPQVAATITVPVQYRNLPKDLEIATGFVSTVVVEARGPAGRLRRLSGVDTAVLLDFSTVRQPGERTFAIGAAQIPLPTDVTLVRALPSQLRFDFERPAVRAIPVTVRFAGALENGLRVASFEQEPKELVITGPGSSVSAVESLETDPVNLTGIKGDFQQTAAVFVSQPGVRFTTPPRVIVKVHVQRSNN
jgi:YbbR domain-containing protein